jgi:tetratricopeptide (TPR) repeat protein
LVNVSATDQGVDVASEYIEYQKAKMTESNIMLMLGHLIIDMGNYDKAEKYFNTLLHSSHPNDEEIACIFYYIGRICRLKGEYERALDALTRAYERHSEARPARLVSAAKAMNAIGIVCMEQDNAQQAINSFECALKLYAKTIAGYHPDVGGTLINLGNIHCDQGQFESALYYFKRAQHIYECNLPPNHPNIAILLNNFGNLYYQQLKFDLALDAYQRALAINENILPANHPDILRNTHNISKVYRMIADQNNAKFEIDQVPAYTLPDSRQYKGVGKINKIFWEETKMPKISKSDIEMVEMHKY